jgi:antitoxin HicB
MKQVSPESRVEDYPFSVRPLSKDEGGGYWIEFPDLPGCASDGDTVDEAVRNGRDAVLSYVRSCVQYGDPVPPPSTPDEGARVPDTVDVREIRARTRLSQSEFARRFGIHVRTLQAWEGGRTSPDRMGRAYLTLIAKSPKVVAEMLAR